MKTEILLDYPTILANQARPVRFAIQFVAEVVGASRPKPAAFCIVLDRSGSMNGAPLIHAKAAAKVAVRNLRTADQFSLAIFDQQARTVIPLQPAKNKQAFYDIIDQIAPGGSTNLTGGWMLGRDELRKAEAGTSRRLLLLSDALLNFGIIEPRAVRKIVVDGLEQDTVRTSCLGFGDNYNEDLMANLAQATNGQFYDADSPEIFPAIFATELDGLQNLCNQNLRVRIKALDFCENYSGLGAYPSVTLPDGRTEFAIGDLVSEEERIVCFGVQVYGLPLIDGKPAFDLIGELLLEVEVLWDELSKQGVTSQTLTQQVRIKATQDPAEVVVNRVVVPWVSLQMAGAAVVDATKLMDAGKFVEAVALLDKTMQEFQQYGGNFEEAIAMLQDMKNRMSSWSSRSRKEMMLASYRSMKSSSREQMNQKPMPPTPNQNPPAEGDEPKAP
jgi:Ca-activated chloride channel family protein